MKMGLYIYLVFFSCTTLFASGSLNQKVGEKCDSAQLFVCFSTVTTAIDDFENIWALSFKGSILSMYKSTDLANSFENPLTIASNIRVDNHGDGRPQLKIDGSHIYITYVKKTNRKYQGKLYIRVFDIDSNFLSKEVQVSDEKNPVSQRFQSLNIVDNKAYLFWLDKRSKLPNSKKPLSSLYHAVFDRKTMTMSKNVLIKENTCQCCRISVARQGRSFYVFYRDLKSGSIRDFTLTSFNMDSKKINHIELFKDQWKIKGCPHHGGALSIENGVIHSVRFSGNPKSLGLKYQSIKNGQTLREMPFGDNNKQAAHPFVVARNKSVFIVYKEFDGVWTKILLLESHNQGLSFSEPVVIAKSTGHNDHPFLISKGAKLYLSWQRYKEGLLFKEIKSNQLNILRFNLSTFGLLSNHLNSQTCIFWSIYCSECLKKLNGLKGSDLNATHFINMDEYDDLQLVKDKIVEFELTGQKNYLIEPLEQQKIRYMFDKTWRGELPKSYKIGGNND
ncbi:MAG: hypothetical protein KC646_03470 [Candidatus Cloacimonetes bacterium]|nr:hypothetical protein [Candidatus Cloacimonadota bacterium]